jgi:hypothetical protein
MHNIHTPRVGREILSTPRHAFEEDCASATPTTSKSSLVGKSCQKDVSKHSTWIRPPIESFRSLNIMQMLSMEVLGTPRTRQYKIAPSIPLEESHDDICRDFSVCFVG